MKKITFSILMLLSVVSFAQRSTPVANSFNGIKFSNQLTRSISDTLYPLSFTTALGCTLTVYSVVGDSGYVVGTNGYGDKEKAQRYDLSNYQLLEGAVTGVYIWAGAKTVATTPGNVVIKAYSVTSGAPGSVIATSDPVSMDLIDTTGSLTYFNFASPAAIPTNGNFFVSMVMSTVVGDTIGLVSSQDGCFENSGYAYEKWSDNSWHSFLSAWPLDFDIAVFPIVDHQFGVGVNNINSGVAVNVFPNPTADNINVNFMLSSNSALSCKIYNAAGMEVLNAGIENFNKGIHNKEINLSGLTNGIYLLAVETQTGKSLQKIVVMH